MRHDLNSGWTVQSPGRPAAAVTLPHDAMVHEDRDPLCANGKETGYFPGGTYTYRRSLHALPEWQGRRVSLFFEGAYHRSTVSLNGAVVGGRPSGYAEFSVDLDGLLVGEANLIEVVVHNSEGPNSRWYSGSGLYRRVWLDVENPTRIARDGLAFVTRALDPQSAELEIRVRLEGVEPGAVLDVVLLAEGQVAAVWTTPAPTGPTSSCSTVMEVPDPRPWSAEEPNLYDAVVILRSGATVLDERRLRVGLRTVSVDPVNGLRINGQTALLRGACVHHDSGVLGAATFRAAEFRRARILKASGFNAVRSAHNPMSRDLLDACDEVGLYVMDELTDLWFNNKSRFDYGSDFRQWWRADLASMVAKNRNHPSVILHSLGNENGETATREGIAVGRQMAALCRELDPSRPVTAGVNLVLNGIAQLGVLQTLGKRKHEREGQPKPASALEPRQPSKISSALFNTLMARAGGVMNQGSRFRFVDRATRGIFAELDVAGYNYGSGSYRPDGRRHPDRVIVGSETLPGDIAKNWQLVEELPYLIGDFMWTGWDYLGEAGLGRWGDASRGAIDSRYPSLTSGGGAIDIIGQAGAMAFHAQAVWGLSQQPALVVRPPDRVATKVVRSPWRSTDAIPSWTWPGHEGEATEVLVYSSADEVELFLDGRSLGRQPAGRTHEHTARFPVTYAPGELVAVARTAGQEVGRSSLVSATAGVALRLTCDRRQIDADGQDLAFVDVELVDESGALVPTSGLVLHAEVTGAGSLAGFGSSDPAPLLGYTGGTHALHHGRALAVIRAVAEPGTVALHVTAEGLPAVSAAVPVVVGARPGASA